MEEKNEMNNSNQTNNKPNNSNELNGQNDLLNQNVNTNLNNSNVNTNPNGSNVNPNVKDEKDKEEIDAYFKDAKKKGFPLGIIFVILILAVAGVFSYYYFVVNSPKNIFLSVISDKFSNILLENTTHDTVDCEYSLEFNITTKNKEYVDIANILNGMSLTGTTGIDLRNNKMFLKLNAFYEQKELLGMSAYYEDEFVYLSLNNLYDKVIKSKVETVDSETDKQLENLDEKIVENTWEALIDVLYETLKDAKYKKEYTTLEKEKVKKITLTIDEELLKKFYTKLQENKQFIENYSKMQDMTENELKQAIEEEKNNLTEEPMNISLYVSLFDNAFIMLDMSSEDERMTLTKETDEYTYKIYENSIVKYQGHIKVKENNGAYNISVSLEDIDANLNVELNLTLSYTYDTEIGKLDTSNAVDYNTLTESDEQKITQNLMSNEAFIALVQDIYGMYGQTTNPSI